MCVDAIMVIYTFPREVMPLVSGERAKKSWVGRHLTLPTDILNYIYEFDDKHRKQMKEVMDELGYCVRKMKYAARYPATVLNTRGYSRAEWVYWCKCTGGVPRGRVTKKRLVEIYQARVVDNELNIE